jgi:hypothetical protein
MFQALCTGCDQNFTVGPQAEAIIAEGEGKVKGYCAIVRQRVAVVIVPEAGHWAHQAYQGRG